MQIKVENNDIRIDKYLTDKIEESRSTILKMIEKGSILVNGNSVKPSYKVKINDVIDVNTFKEEIDIKEEDIPLDIVYEDDDVIVVNKKSGMVVHPGSGNKNHTLVNALLHYTNSLSDCNGEVRPGIVHRIDKDTSGLLLVAKNNASHRILAEDLKEKKIKRKYIALVKGVLKYNHITIDAPIGRDKIKRKQMKVTEENSKNAVTHVNVLKRYQDYTLVECILETGRTHQIRVHLSYIGYPIYNDPVYSNLKCTSFGQFLHSSEISFDSPISKKHIELKVPLPKEFQSFLDTLEKEDA